MQDEKKTSRKGSNKAFTTPKKETIVFDESAFTTPSLSPKKGVPTLPESISKVMKLNVVKDNFPKPSDTRTMVRLFQESFGETNLLRLRDALTSIQQLLGPDLRGNRSSIVATLGSGDAPEAVRNVIRSYQVARVSEIHQEFGALFVMESHRSLFVNWTTVLQALKDTESEVSAWLNTRLQRPLQAGKHEASYLHDEMTKQLYGEWHDKDDGQKKKTRFKNATDFGQNIQIMVDGFGQGILGFFPPNSNTL